MNASELLIERRKTTKIHTNELTAISKVFLTDEIETHALSGIYLDIVPGEYVAIVGPSGCGKSTLLAILGLLDSPSGGALDNAGFTGYNQRF